MQPWKMNGNRISDPLRFQQYFDPRALLRQRREAACFLYQQMGNLSPACHFHCEMFYQAVFEWRGCMGTAFQWPEDYALAEGPSRKLEGALERTLVRQALSASAVGEVLQSLWDLTLETELPEQERLRLYCLLSAGYLLADTNLSRHPLSPREAVLAYENRPEEESPWLVFPEAGPLSLAARRTPYRLLLHPQEPIGEQQIHLCPILAQPSQQGALELPVTLHIYSSPSDPNPRIETLLPGDYCYCNCIGNKTVLVHPIQAESSRCRMTRKGHLLTIQQGDQRLEKKVRQLVSMAPAQVHGGWILLYPQGVDYSAYPLYASYDYRLPEQGIVEVAFQDAQLLLLDSQGYVHSNLFDPPPERYGTLTQFLTRKEVPGCLNENGSLPG